MGCVINHQFINHQLGFSLKSILRNLLYIYNKFYYRVICIKKLIDELMIDD